MGRSAWVRTPVRKPRIGTAAILGLALLQSCSVAPTGGGAASRDSVAYGANQAASGTFEHDGVRFYYESYGSGEPLILIHGNGGSISNFSAQIAHFSKRYRVIAMDSRDQGKSGDSPTQPSYETMADDQIALMDHLKIGKAHIVGWSDGAIEALILAMRHPERADKVVAMAANLDPKAIWPETAELAAGIAQQVSALDPNSSEGRRAAHLAYLLNNEPNIEPRALQAITAPVLVLAGDHDLILDSHTLEIFHNIPNGQLGIFPDATHAVPYDDPARFNAAIDRFLSTPFRKRERIADFIRSFEAMAATKAK